MGRQQKSDRILNLYLRLLRGEVINKQNYAMTEEVTLRTFERDIQTLRNCLSDAFSYEQVLYDSTKGGYCLQSQEKPCGLSLIEGFFLLHALQYHGALREDEAAGLRASVLAQLPGSEQAILCGLLPDMSQYRSPTHNQAIMKMVQDLLLMILKKRKIKIQCSGPGREEELTVLPLEITCEGQSFFLIAANALEDEGPCLLLDISTIRAFIPLQEYFLVSDGLRARWEMARQSVSTETASTDKK